MRQPVVAGQFYDKEEKSLRIQIEKCFSSSFGPLGKLKKSNEKNSLYHGTEQVSGMICPHAGLMYSGPAAAWAYHELNSELSNCTKKNNAHRKSISDVFVILGPNHTGIGRTSLLAQDFKTPLGIAKYNAELAQILLSDNIIINDERAHLYEHSIEVQLPFLQYTFGDNFSFLAIVLSSEVKIDEVALTIKKAINEFEAKGHRVRVIASSDFIHYGESYYYTPFGTGNKKIIKENVRELDMKAINYIINGEKESFRKMIKDTGATICGYLPIYVLLSILEKKNVKGRLLSYYTSADIINDYSNSVSYASIIFELTKNN